jgi:hypothetical protein
MAGVIEKTAIDEEIEAATNRLKQARKLMWRRKLSAPEIQKPPDRPKKSDFVVRVAEKRYSRYERENR